MIFEYVDLHSVQIILIVFVPIIIACLVKLPVIKFTSVCKNIPYIIAVSALTTTLFEIYCLPVFLIGFTYGDACIIVLMLVGALILVPCIEIHLYGKLSKVNNKQILWIYLANVFSALLCGLYWGIGIFANL